MQKKGRKRTAANILDEYDTPSSSIANQLSTKDVEFKTRKPRNKEQCFCSKCNGKMVDKRTKRAHDDKGNTSSLKQLHSEQLTPSPIATLPNEIPMSQLLIEPLDSAMEVEENLSQTIIDEDDELEELKFTFLSRKRKKADSLRRNIINLIEGDLESDDDFDSDDGTSSEDGEYPEEDNHDESLNNFENYSHPML